MITEGSNNMSAPDEDGSEEDLPRETASGEPSAVEELQQKLQESEKKYLYLYSDFENFRRRNERERLDFLKFGHEGFLKELLQVMDNFERALEHAKSLAGNEKGTPLSQVAQGIEMIAYQFAEALKAQGVTPVVSGGQKFDPNLHEAVGEEDSKLEAGTVTKELHKGYMLHSRLLRPSRVMVAKKA